MTQPFDGPKPSVSRPDVQPKTNRPAAAGEFSRHQPNFFSPAPLAAEPSVSDVSTKRRLGTVGRIGISVAAAGVLAVVIGIGFAARERPPAPPAVTSSLAVASSPAKTMTVSMADRDDKATDYLKKHLAGSSAGAALAVAAKELQAENALALLKVKDVAPQVVSDLESDRRRLYRVYLLDFLDQDGDRVELFLDGISYGNIDLKNEGASVLLPVAAGTPLQVKIVATGDGGGGVTVAFISSVGEARTSVMQLGDFEQWQVVVQ